MPKLVLDAVVAGKLIQALNTEEGLVLTYGETRHVLEFLVDKPDPRWEVLMVNTAPPLNEAMRDGWEPFGVVDGVFYLRKLAD